VIVTVKDGIPVAKKMTRIVEGARGAYMEFHRDDIIKENLFIPQRQLWRVTPSWITKVYYVWYETKDGAKFYYQQKLVNYADYFIGFYYVDPTLVKEVADEEPAYFMSAAEQASLEAEADYWEEKAVADAR